MSGGDLPITGGRAVVMLSLFGLGSYAVPTPFLMAAVAAVLVVVGAVLVRFGFRRRSATPKA